MKRFLVVAVALLLVIGGTPRIALAGDTMCTGVLTGTHDNVVVPAGSSCFVFGATINGNVKVFGNLDAFGATIGGSVNGEPGAGRVDLHEFTTVKGNVTIKGTTGLSGYFQSTILGDLQYEGNSGFLFAAEGTIGGNLKFEKNTGGGLIDRNTIAGNLQCKENTPPPVGAGNTVGGNKEDQCAGF